MFTNDPRVRSSGIIIDVVHQQPSAIRACVCGMCVPVSNNIHIIHATRSSARTPPQETREVCGEVHAIFTCWASTNRWGIAQSLFERRARQKSLVCDHSPECTRDRYWFCLNREISRPENPFSTFAFIIVQCYRSQRVCLCLCVYVVLVRVCVGMLSTHNNTSRRV